MGNQTAERARPRRPVHRDHGDGPGERLVERGPHSLLAEDYTWALVSTYTANTLPASVPWRDEVFQVRSDGSAAVRRLAHHRSVYTTYWESPRANISRDACRVTFTSNGGNPGGYTDAYVASLKR